MRISDWSSDVCSSDLIDREKPQGSEEFQLRGEAKARQGRLRIYKINIGKAQAPSSDQIPARNTPIHQPTPYDGATVLFYDFHRQYRMPRSQNVLRLGQNRSLGPTGPISSGGPSGYAMRGSAYRAGCMRR